jgi:hypothetical protein
MGSYPDSLRVLYDGTPVGEVIVTQRHPRKFFGRFSAGAGFAECRAEFAEAARWSRQFDEVPSDEPIDYLAWDRWIEVTQRITKRITLPELPVGIEEFAVDHEMAVEVTLDRMIAEPEPAEDRPRGTR